MGTIRHTWLPLNPRSSEVEHGMRLKSQEFSFSLPSRRLVFSSCCFVLAPVAVRPEASSLWLYSVSSLPVSPPIPPVIIIITYGSATAPPPPPPQPQPSPFTKQIFSSVNNNGFYLFHCRIYVNACLVSLLTYLTAELYSCYLLNLVRPFKWPCRYQTCNGCSHWIKSTECRFKLDRHLTPEMAHGFCALGGFLAALCNRSWIFLTLEKLFILTLNAMTYQAALSSRWWEHAKQFVSFLSQLWFKFKL